MTFWDSRRGLGEFVTIAYVLYVMFNDNIGYSFVLNIFDIENILNIFS